MGCVPIETLTDADSFPHTLTKEGSGLYIANNETGTTLIVKVYLNDGTIDFRVKNNLNIPLEKFFKIDVTQITTSFDIVVLGPSGGE